MKYSLPLIALLAFCLVSCDDDPSEPPPPEPITETHVIRDVDYVKNKFFLVDDPASFLGAFPYSIEVFVTVTPQDLIQDPSIVRFPGWAVVDSTADGAGISDAVAEIQSGGVPERTLQQDFRRLRRDMDYLVLATQDTVAIGIELKTPVPVTALRSVAIRYRNQLDQVIGGTLGTSPDTLILEMIKPPDPRPDGPFGFLWDYALRNAYYLGFDTINPAHLSVVIHEVNTTRVDTSRPEGSNVPYVQIFGIDVSGAPDGKVDNFFHNWGEDLKRGILWMPVAFAFAPPAERVQEWTNGAFAFSGPYLPQYEKSLRIYTELLNPIAEQDAHQYQIEATVTTPAP